MAKKALSLIQGKNRQDYNGDETLRFALAHIVQVVERQLLTHEQVFIA